MKHVDLRKFDSTFILKFLCNAFPETVEEASNYELRRN